MDLSQLNLTYPNKTAFITGAGSGLGLAFAQLLSSLDWTLHLTDVNLETLKNARGALGNKENIYLYHFNISDKKAFQQSVREVYETSSKVDLVINNAGIGDGSLFEEYAIEDWEKMIDINVLGVFYGCHFFVPHMIKHEGGMIINVGSAAGFMNAPGMSAYNVSKAAVYSLSETLYHELKGANIHVSVLTPTFFKTNVMSQSTGPVIFKNFVDKQMKYSTTNADEVAAITLSKALNGTFQIIHPKEARRNYLIKKWAPKLVEKQFVKLLAKFKPDR